MAILLFLDNVLVMKNMLEINVNVPAATVAILTFLDSVLVMKNMLEIKFF